MASGSLLEGGGIQAVLKVETLTEGQRALVCKLCAVGLALTWIQKRGKNVAQGYNYATEADLVLAIRKELYDRKVFLFPRMVSYRRETFATTSKDGKERQNHRTDLEMAWLWCDGETGATIEATMPGSGVDPGDKDTYKAITGSEKYVLLKTFLIPTFDDAEQMSPSDKKAAQERVKAEKVAELKASKAAREAHSEEEAQKELKKGQVLFIRIPERFHGEFAAVYGKPISDAGMENFFADCGAQRFKGPEGIFYKLEVTYMTDCEAQAKKLGYTVDRNAE